MPAPPAKAEISAPYPNPSNATARTGFGKLWDYVTGLLGSTGNAPEARVALGFGPTISRRQRLINSQFVVNQRNAPTTVTLAAGAYGHDRWKAGASGCTYSTTVVGPDLQINITAGSLVQVVEGVNVEGGDYTLSWQGTAQGKIGAGAFGATGLTASAVTAGANLAVEFRTGTVRMPQLEPGLIATPYERRPLDAEVAACQRYYETGNGQISGYGAGPGIGYSFTLPFKVSKRATPTLGYASTSTSGTSVFDARAVTNQSLVWYCESNGAVPFWWIGTWTVNAEL